MTDGSYDGLRLALELIIRDKKDCVLTPIPQYPIYSGRHPIIFLVVSIISTDCGNEWNPTKLRTGR
jgi:aspartate/methionine/tyrosine aminotransferase